MQLPTTNRPQTVIVSAVRRPLARFAAGATLAFIGVIAPLSVWLLVSAPDLPLGLGDLLPRVMGWTASLGVGYAAALRGMRRWLRTEALSSGRRNVVTGAAAAAALVTIIPVLGPVPEVVRLGVAAAVGAGLAAAMYFPWILPADERRALRALEVDQG